MSTLKDFCKEHMARMHVTVTAGFLDSIVPPSPLPLLPISQGHSTACVDAGPYSGAFCSPISLSSTPRGSADAPGVSGVLTRGMTSARSSILLTAWIRQRISLSRKVQTFPFSLRGFLGLSPPGLLSDSAEIVGSFGWVGKKSLLTGTDELFNLIQALVDPAASTSPRSLWEMQNLRSRPRPTEPESLC